MLEKLSMPVLSLQSPLLKSSTGTQHSAWCLEQLLDACGPSGELADQGASRNRALLWLFLETGLSVSEVCALRVRDVDRAHGQLLIQGKGPKARRVLLGEQVSRHLWFYLDAYRLKAVGGITGDTPLFLSERHQQLVPNTITLLLARLHQRAGITAQQISPTMLRDTFAVCYLQAGGSPGQLREALGLDARTPITRYQRLREQGQESVRASSRLS